jgi:hypothetical protein
VLRPPAAPDQPRAVPVVVIEIAVVERVTTSVADIASKGVDLRGALVGRLEAIADERVLPELKLRGTLRDIARDVATIEHDDGSTEALTRANFEVKHRGTTSGGCSSMRSGRALGECEGRHEGARGRRSRGSSWVKRLHGAHDLLRKESLEIVPGVHVTVGDLVNPARWPNGSSTVRRAEPAVFVFDRAAARPTAHRATASSPTDHTAAPRRFREPRGCASSARGRSRALPSS